VIDDRTATEIASALSANGIDVVDTADAGGDASASPAGHRPTAASASAFRR